MRSFSFQSTSAFPGAERALRPVGHARVSGREPPREPARRRLRLLERLRLVEWDDHVEPEQSPTS